MKTKVTIDVEAPDSLSALYVRELIRVAISEAKHMNPSVTARRGEAVLTDIVNDIKQCEFTIRSGDIDCRSPALYVGSDEIGVSFSARMASDGWWYCTCIERPGGREIHMDNPSAFICQGDALREGLKTAVRYADYHGVVCGASINECREYIDKNTL